MKPCKGRRGARSPRKVASPGMVARPRATPGRDRGWREDLVRTLPSSLICSVLSRRVETVSEEIRRIVDRVWTEHIGIPPEWTPEYAQQWIADEAQRMTNRINLMQAEQQQVLIRDWTVRHEGQPPDTMTHIGLITMARDQCQEIVLEQELYELVPVEEEDRELTPLEQQLAQERQEEAEERAFEAARSDPQRWRGVYRSEPTEEVEDTVKMVWPERSNMFRVVAALLWQSRVEDAKPVPLPPQMMERRRRQRRANETLREELTAMVEEDIRASRLPE